MENAENFGVSEPIRCVVCRKIWQFARFSWGSCQRGCCRWSHCRRPVEDPLHGHRLERAARPGDLAQVVEMAGDLGQADALVTKVGDQQGQVAVVVYGLAVVCSSTSPGAGQCPGCWKLGWTWQDGTLSRRYWKTGRAMDTVEGNQTQLTPEGAP